jgi:hypothetical protein
MAHFNYLSAELQADLKATAEAIVAPGKGILAADESTGKCCPPSPNKDKDRDLTFSVT